MGHDLPEYRQAASQYRADRLFVKDPMNWHEAAAFVDQTDEPWKISENVEGGGLCKR